MSRKRAEMNLAELEKLAAMQATDEEIAHWFGVSQKTVQRKKRDSAEFRQILETGRAKGRISVRRNLFELSKTNVAAAIFLAKNLLGYRTESAVSGMVTPSSEEFSWADIVQSLKPPQGGS